MLSAAQLKKKLGLSATRLARLIKQGLPCKGKGAKRKFNPMAVAAWLKQHGHAIEIQNSEFRIQNAADQVARTIAEAALLLDVAPRTLAQWQTDATFPGQAGTPGRRDGYYPIAAIRTWHLATHGAQSRHGASDAELAAVKRLKAQIECDRDQVDLERELGTIHDTAAEERLIRRQIATAKALLEEMADKVQSRLPSKVPPAVRQRIRQAIEEVLAETLNAIAELAAGDTDATDDAPDEPAAAAQAAG